MIIQNKKECTGCTACANACPQQCISMEKDEEGFSYPEIDGKQCINCNLCDKVCVLSNSIPIQHVPISILGCRVKKEKELLSASSGGLFGLIACSFIKKGGVVIAARFDENNNVIHDIISSEHEIELFKRSKYVQSDLGSIFTYIKQELIIGNSILFVGTPCQVSGLLSFLRKPYESLYCLDFVCHGVPSPAVWQEYLKILGDNVSNINFRDKSSGWPAYSFSYIKNGEKYIHKAVNNPYMRGFLHNLYLRPSCHVCRFKGFSSRADITLSDFWGVWNTYSKWNDQKGAGVLAINTVKGEQIIERLDKEDFDIVRITYEKAYVNYNSSAIKITPYNENREEFFSRFRREPLIPLIKELTRESFWMRLRNFLSSIKHTVVSK